MDSMKRKLVAAVAALCIMLAPAASFALDAYIDMKSGIIIGRGEAELQRVDTYHSARGVAIEKAKSEIRKVLERQPVDPGSTDTRTIEDYLDDNPDKLRVFTNFVESARLIMHRKDEENDSVAVTLQLLVEGPGGYREMLARMTGRELPDTASGYEEGGELDDDVRAELAEHLAGRSPDELKKPNEILILNFMNFTNFVEVDIGSVMAGELASRFMRDHRFEITSGIDAEVALAEKGKSFDDLWNADITRLMKIEGVDGVVIGAITKYKASSEKHGIGGTGYLQTTFDLEVDLRILNARNGRWSYYEKVPVQLSERTFSLKSADDAEKIIDISNLDNLAGLAAQAFQAAVSRLEERMRAAFPLEGYVLKVSGDRIYINLTRAEGVKDGDVLDVYRIGEMLYDPVTGQEIDRIRDRIGTIEVVETKETYSQASTQAIPQEPIAAGDIVTLK